MIFARYGQRLAGTWRGVYVAGAILALYFNVFVLVVQLFRRLPALIAAAPTQKEAPFVVTQVLIMVLFVWLGKTALKRFHPEAGTPGGIAVPVSA